MEEVALAEADVINLKQKTSGLQLHLNQQCQDKHDSSCESCSPPRWEDMQHLLPSSLNAAVPLFLNLKSGHYSN